jgi:hypothetical protein
MMSPGFCALPLGRLSVVGNVAGDFHRGLELGQPAHRADDRRAAGHVEFHRFHALAGLQREAPGIEGDAFADERHLFSSPSTAAGNES